MSKSLTGAAYFEALGRRSISLECSCECSGHILFSRRNRWPAWALHAYQRGRINQGIACCIPKGVITYNRSALTTSELLQLIPGLSPYD